jgi:hypothetical protein
MGKVIGVEVEVTVGNDGGVEVGDGVKVGVNVGVSVGIEVGVEVEVSVGGGVGGNISVGMGVTVILAASIIFDISILLDGPAWQPIEITRTASQ